jgi:hypothetical protein
MTEHDPLDSLLREWEAPEPPSAMDARVLAAYRAVHRPPPWRRIWSARVTIPVPVLAALLPMVAAGVWLLYRSQPPAAVAPPGGGYLTRLETAGFKPLPDGATRVIRAGELKP